MDWLLHADIDWETLTSKPKEYSPGIAGALFGAGWWCWSAFLHCAATVQAFYILVRFFVGKQGGRVCAQRSS